MTIQDLEYFQIICREKSITGAARQLYITPQGLSRTIKNMEHELNAVLLHRTVSGVSLTESGQYLYDHLSNFLWQYQSICRNIDLIEQKSRHEINLLLSYGILRLVSPDFLLHFQKDHPNIKMTYREYPDKTVIQRFIESEGNIAISLGEPFYHGIDTTKIESFPVKLLVNHLHPLSNRAQVSVSDLRGEKIFIENSEFEINDQLREKCREHGFRPNILLETTDFALCYQMVKQNKGISLTTDAAFDAMADDRLVRIPFDEDFFWTVNVLTRSNKDIHPDVLLFIDAFRERVQEIHSKGR